MYLAAPDPDCAAPPGQHKCQTWATQHRAVPLRVILTHLLKCHDLFISLIMAFQESPQRPMSDPAVAGEAALMFMPVP